MDTMSAFAMGQGNRGRPVMVFDWDKAAREIVARKAQSASAGLSGDWEWTGGDILKDGKPIPKDDTYVYLASTWATPELKIDGETINCYMIQDAVPQAWGKSYADIYWPDSARLILESR